MPSMRSYLMRCRAWPDSGFAIVPVLLGFIPGAVTFALDPRAKADIGLTAVRLPGSIFIVIWIVLFMGMGMAARQLWHLRLRHGVDTSVPLVMLGAAYLQANTFWLADSLRAITIADASGLLWASATVWAVSRYSRRAALWLTPWLIWMPVTLTIKVVLLCSSR